MGGLTKLYICPGFHDPSLTQSFLDALISAWGSTWCDRFLLGVVPPEVPPYGPEQILEHLEGCLRGQGLGEWGVGSGGVGSEEQGVRTGVALVWVGFSAGVVGGLLAARRWHREGLGRGLGCSVAAFMAIDGWGVPLWADFPVYSLSPDRFAYETMRPLRSPQLPHFYGDPGVSHLALWESPHRALGWEESAGGERLRLTAAQYLQRRLRAVGL